MRHTPEAGAVCGNSARTDLRGGRGVNLRPYRNKSGSCPAPQVQRRGFSFKVSLHNLCAGTSSSRWNLWYRGVRVAA